MPVSIECKFVSLQQCHLEEFSHFHGRVVEMSNLHKVCQTAPETTGYSICLLVTGNSLPVFEMVYYFTDCTDSQQAGKVKYLKPDEIPRP